MNIIKKIFVFLLFFGVTSLIQGLNQSDWKYKKLILIDNKTNPNTIQDKPFLITLDSTYIDFSFAKPKGEDLLFLDSDGETVLSFWIESWTPPTAKVWVNIPEVPANNEKLIKMFYGNPNSDTLSNGKKTFTFFDSFETFNNKQQNAITPQVTPTYDTSGQMVHPDLVYIPEKWNGYKYWMAITPYPGSDDSFENPSIIVSNDGTNWISPVGITNPLVPTPDGWNNDPDMLLVDTTMILYFNESNNNNSTYIKRMTSTDGINWTSPEVVITVPWHLMSPTIIYEDGTYYMWYVRSPEGCWSNFQNLTIRTSTDGINWEAEIPVNLQIDGRVVWHLNVRKIGSKYGMIFASYSKNSDCLHATLFYAESTDKIIWNVYDSPIIITPNDVSAWDNREIYRSTFLLEDDYFRLWYSAVNNSDIWHLGYTEGNLSDFLNKIFWNKREGGLVANGDYIHSGKYALQESISDHSVTPKVFRSIAKKGSYNVWFYDDLNTINNHKAIFYISDIYNSKIGLGIDVNESSTNYVYSTDNSSYSQTNISRTEGWHKFTLNIKDNFTELYIDTFHVTELNELDESEITRLSLEGGTTGYNWFDDVYWFENLEVNPNIKPIVNPKLLVKINDEVKEEDFTSYVVAKLDTIFEDVDTNNPIIYTVNDKNDSLYLWINDENKLWVESLKDYFGIDSIVVSASNKYGLTTIDTFLLITKPVNDPPILKGLPDISLNEDDTAHIALNSYVADIDSDTSDIRFIVRLLNSNNNNNNSQNGNTLKSKLDESTFIFGDNELQISIHNSNNIAEIYAKPDSSGIFKLLFTAIDDSLATDSDTMIVNVLSINDLPTFTGLPDSLFITKDSTIKIELWDFVYDKETPDSLLQFSFFVEAPELKLNFENSTGILSINVTNSFIGISNLFISVKDNNGAIVKDTLVVKVEKITGVENQLENILPAKYALNQNYPNPFNPTTTISFDLPYRSKVYLDIYNLLGQKVFNVINNNLEAGSHSIHLNVSELTSGIYIYLIRATDLENKIFVKSRKMILLK